MTKSVSLPSWLRSHLHVPRALLVQTGWTTFGYATTQVIRLGSTMILTRLLSPDLFGVTVLLTSLRIGIELFTDLGIGQGVIASRRYRDADFYSTAWTLQIARGVILGLVTLALLPVLRTIYDDNTLRGVLPVLAVFLVLTGAHSIAPMIATKELRTKRVAAYEIACAVAQAGLTIAAVLVSPTIIGLIAGQVLSAAFATFASYALIPGLKLRLKIERSATAELVSIGKWIFLSSIIYFLSGYMDRLVLGKYATLAMLGIYGVARALGDAVAQFGGRMSNTIIFPKIAASENRGADLKQVITKPRRQYMAVIAAGIAGLIVLSQPLITLMYDARYHDAAAVLPWIALSVWFFVLNAFTDSLALGLARPRIGMIGNLVKFIVLAALLPVGVVKGGIIGAAIAGLAAEMARYAALTAMLYRERLHFARQDLIGSAIVVGLSVAVHALLQQIFPQWFSLNLFSGYAFDWIV